MNNKGNQVSFVWTKSLGGYDWQNHVDSSDSPYLVEKDCSKEIKEYNLLEDITLFAKFADTKATPDSFKDWANKYGMLTIGENLESYGVSFDIPNDYDSLEKPLYHEDEIVIDNDFWYSGLTPESQDFWFSEHHDLSFAVMLWELLIKKDIKQLGMIIQWIWENKNAAIQVQFLNKESFDKCDTDKLTKMKYRRMFTYDEETLYDDKIILNWVSPLCRGHSDLIKPAELYIQRTIARKLKEYPLKNVVIHNAEEKELFRADQPTSFLSAMWYQFFLVMTGKERIRRCQICGEWQNMKSHRNNWKKHKECATRDRVRCFRKKAATHK